MSEYERDPGCRFQAGPQFHTADRRWLCCPWGTNKIKQLGTGVVGLQFGSVSAVAEYYSCWVEVGDVRKDVAGQSWHAPRPRYFGPAEVHLGRSVRRT